MGLVRVAFGLVLPLLAATASAAPVLSKPEGRLDARAPHLEWAATPAIPRDPNALSHLMMELYQGQRYAEALPLVPAYVSGMRQRFGDRSLEYGKALALGGLIQQSTNHLSDARESLQAALDIVKRRSRPGDPLLTRTEITLAQIYQDLGRIDDAERILRQVASGAEARKDLNLLAEVDNTLSTVLVDKAEFAEAETLASKAYDIWNTSSEPDKVTTALANLALVYQSERRLSDAEAIYRRIIPVLEKLGPSGVGDLARMLGNLSNVYGDTGRYAEAEHAEQRVLALFEKATGADSPDVARALTNMAVTFSDQRKDHDAEDVLNRALRIEQTAFGPESTQLAFTLSTLGTVLMREDRYAEAEALFRRDVAITEKNPDNARQAAYLNSLAISVAAQGREDEATRLLSQSLAVAEKVYGPNSVELGAPLLNLGIRALRAKRYDEAEALFQRSLTVTRSTNTPAPERLADALEGLGDVRSFGHKPDEAATFYTDAFAVEEKTFGPDFPASASLLAKLGAAAGQKGDWTRALDFTRRAYGVANRAHDRLSHARQTADSSAGLLARASRSLAGVDWQAAAKDPGQASPLKDEAFGAAQRTNLSSAASALVEMATRFGAGAGAMADVVRRQQDLAAQAQALEKGLTATLASSDPKGRDVKIANLRAQAASVDASLAEVNARIARDFPNYAELSDPKPLGIADVQKLLSPDEVLVTWLVGETDTLVWAITKESSAWQSIDLGAKPLDDMVAKVRASLDLDKVNGAIAEGKPGRDVVFDLATADALYEKLLAPVAGQLVGKTTIVEVPIGSLTSLPLQLLLTDGPRRSATSMNDPVYRDAPWLAKSYAVTVLPAVSALRALRVFTQASAAPKPLTGFADPVFSRTPTEGPRGGGQGTASPQRKILTLSSYYRGGSVNLDALRQGLPPLPETADELRTVAHDLSANAADLKIGEDATVGAVKTMPLDQYRVVYFATHGLVAGDVGGLTEPALALTIPVHPTQADSGLLTASDVGQLKLNADWVVLSACNTAAGDKPGAEGLSGLTRAFFYAGARALLVSNWSVRSDAAVDLTTHTFARMAAAPGLGRSEALRQSMLELIASGEDHAYPAVWAPFVVVGEGGAAAGATGNARPMPRQSSR